MKASQESTNVPITAATLSEKKEEELALCEGCTGLDCKKKAYKYMQPSIIGEGEEARILHAWCQFKPKRKSYSRSLIPLKFVGKTFEDYVVTKENRKAVDGAKWFVDNKPTRGIFLFGEVGTGKTYLAALIAQEYIAKGKAVTFGDVPSLLADLKATFGKGTTDEVLTRYCECDLLILDDIGTGKITDWNIGVLYQVINARYNADRLTIVTSNCALQELETVFTVRDNYGKTVDALTGKRIVSRLKEMTYPILIEGTDRRH